ncbi:MAG: pyridoxal phosphate-dependent aminotransferase [Cyclobacteriaceae bacterium]
MMSGLSNRIENLAESATLAMAAKAREFKQKGIDVISLSLGEPDFKTPKHIQEGAKAAIDEGKYFGYPPVNGYLDLREAISKKFAEENNLTYSPSQIVVSNGAKQSIANIMFALINPGDEVIVFSPFWVSYSAMIELAEGVPVFVEGKLEDDFKVTAEQLQKAITPKTKAIIFSSPCNPTGSVFTETELKAISEVVLNHEDIFVISDEIYEHINYTDAHCSIGSLPGMIDRTITVNGFAKGFAMTGWRIGYIGAPEWIAKGAAKMQGQITSANCSIAQRAGYTALTSDLGPTREMAKAYKERRSLVYDLLNSVPGFKTNMPQGAFYFFPDVSHYFGKEIDGTKIKNASDLCIYILEDAHVSLVTGEAFGSPDCVRLSYAASEESLKEAIKRIKASLEKLK